MALTIFTFFGRLHPLVVHLPIGFILLAMLFDLLSYTKKYQHFKAVVPVILLVGFISAVVACIFGYMLSSTGDYDAETLQHHKWSGIVMTCICGLLYIASLQRFKNIVTLSSKVFSVLLVCLVGLISYAGHQGGSLTHGSDYITLQMLTETVRPKPDSVKSAMIFEDVVQPLLISRCGQCHSNGKLKGRLSVLTLQTLLKGGKHGAAITPGSLEKSELYQRITLSKDDEHFMPTDGKAPLKKNEIAIVKWWIEKANAVEGKKMSELKSTETIEPQIAAYLQIDGATEADETADGINQNINPDIPQTADTAALQRLRSKGVLIRIMLKKPAMLDVTLPAGAVKNVAEIKADIAKIAKNIIWLNASGNGYNDADVDYLNTLTNLEKLRLDNNPITDAITDRAINLKHLESINLNKTNITSAAIEKLHKNATIKRIYTWQTAADTTAKK